MGIFTRIFRKKEQHIPKSTHDDLLSNQAENNLLQNQTEEQIETEQIDESVQDYSAYTVYFTKGHLSKIDPYPKGGYYENRDIANNAYSIISDGIKYDLTSVASIHSIKIPAYAYSVSGGIGTTGFLEYVLRMRSGNYWNERKFDLSIACLEKATELMRYSPMGWPSKDYFRIVNELNDLGELKKARKWKKWIEDNVPSATAALSISPDDRIAGIAKESFKSRIASCKTLGTDLVEIGDLGACCEKCAMYRKRIYSLYGRNKLFPRFPKDFHFGCGMSVWPYVYGAEEPTFSCTDVVAYSNRPFIDDRTEEEKQNYIERMKKIASAPSIIRELSLNRIIYYRLVQLIPNEMPKSLGGFSRMKNNNSKNYQALVKKAEAAGFVFPETLKDVENWPENQ